MESELTAHGVVAERFAAALVAGRHDDAHRLLSAAVAKKWPAEKLQRKFERMVDYFAAPPDVVRVVGDMTEWPDKRADDLGWVYVSIEGPGACEAVTVVVRIEEERSVIRSIEWGRP